MAKVKFFKGTEASIKSLVTNKTVTEGATYVATDTGRMFLGTSSSTLLSISAESVDTVPVSKGGTGATTAAAARSNLGAAAATHSHSTVTTSAAGFMSASDKSKLDGIAEGATVGMTDSDKTTVESSISAAVAEKADKSHTHAPADLTAAVPITKGGTGSTTAAAARTALGAAASSHTHSPSDLSSAVTVAKGGTGATTAAAARTNLGAAAASHSHAAADITSVNASAITGTIAQANLPSYVDDVVEYDGTSNFPTTGETGKIYTDTSTNKIYRWGGSSYVVISDTIALGETSSTAYRGDRGATAYTHSQTTGNPHGTTKSDLGLGNVENKSSATIRGELTKSNVTTALGYTPPTTNTTYSTATTSANGLMSSTDKSKLDGIATGATANTVDSALSSTSTNAVQNKVVNSALAGKVPNTSAGVSAAINKLGTGTTTPTDADYYVCQYAGGGTTTTTYLRRPLSSLWNWIKSKADSVYAAVSHTHAASAITSGTLAVANGGTGASTAAAARTNLGAAASSHTHSYLPLSGGTLTGAVVHNAKNNQFSCSGGTWVSGMTQANAPITFTSAITKDGTRYDPYMWGKNTDGDVWNFGGGASNTVGLWGFKNGRTENGTDWQATVNVTSGAVYTSGTITSGSGFSGSLTGNASTATTATKLSTSAGSATQPVYFSSGKPVACTYTLGKTVPSNAVFTDTNTHYTSKNVVGASTATSNTTTALTNGNVYLNSVENGSVTSAHKIYGSGATTVTTDTSGNIIINSTDNNTNTTYSAGTGISLSGTTFSNSGVRSVSTGSSNGTISVNTNGTSADVSVKGLGSAAYTASTAYASASHSHNYISVGTTQPTDSNTKIWIKTAASS